MKIPIKVNENQRFKTTIQNALCPERAILDKISIFLDKMLDIILDKTLSRMNYSGQILYISVQKSIIRIDNTLFVQNIACPE
jgi:hypothetical protein